MTVAANVNSMTGNAFTSTDVTAAIVTAGVIITGYIKTTWSEGLDDSLDAAASLLAVKILERGKTGVNNLTSDTPIFISEDWITGDIQVMLDEYLEEGKSWSFDNTLSSNEYNNVI